MKSREAALRELLSGGLPLERVGPHLRHAVRRALAGRDPERMKQVAGVVVGELLRRGDLIRVAVEGGEGSQGPFYLLKGTTRLLDLESLQEVAATPERQPPAGRWPDLEAVSRPRRAEDYADLLGVMEEAQDLDIGTPGSGQSGQALEGILALLARLTPQFHVFLMVNDSDMVRDDPQHLFHLTPEDPAYAWLQRRTAGQSFWIPDSGELPRTIQERERAWRDGQGPWMGEGVSGTVATPLMSSPEVGDGVEVGLFFLVAREPWEKDAMLKLARRLTAFVSRRWQRQTEVNRRIHRDRLTGVYNRAYFDDQFTLELERARRSETPLTLVIADLDHFKQVNDRYGHQVGDLALQRVAQRLQRQLRRIDSICRIGGEEFGLILPHTSEAAARDVIQRLLNEDPLEEFHYLDDDLSIPLTFSYGTATFPDGGSDPFELYRKADAMLFLSKDKGRNQCFMWNAGGDHQQLVPTHSDS